MQLYHAAIFAILISCSAAIVPSIVLGIFADSQCATPPAVIANLVNNATLCQTISVPQANFFVQVSCISGQMKALFCSDSTCSSCQPSPSPILPAGVCGADITGLGQTAVYYCAPTASSDKFCAMQ